MDFSVVGQKIKELRKNIGLSQEELAEGICTQAQISKIEKGDVFPYASTLFLISRKLGVDVNYFFDIGMTPRLDYVQEVSKQLQIARRSMNYKEMKEIVSAEEENPLFFNNNRNLQLLQWHKGIYQYELNKDVEKAEEILRKAISLSHTTDKIWSEREIEILLTIGVLYSEEGDWKKALEIYQEVKTHILALPNLQDFTLRTRLFYNIARVLTRLKNFEESTQYCNEAIDWCVHKDNMYLLGELHYHIGYNFELQGNLEDAKKYMQKALIVFELQADDKFMQFIRRKIENFTQ
ncbi:helix-turn-helix transcriptional regulator [Rossellomorea vietnamensis]|uniref:helix-turn-helix domain-containing protein n=1 Tax=Rossellomorea vietnamensis TaxID=218284 RepID=UPI001CC8EFBA|nr:helix-turn-helix domain-containing protein [Rossellomorea vietnamensis]MCA0151572.1 helix-turn-helix transcriptional regulator [Rossellomorea vietnamensis]